MDEQRPAPPRAFAQGVGTVFQFTGVTLFLIGFAVCCGSSLLSRDTATQTELTRIGWSLAGDHPSNPDYSAQRAVTISLLMAVFLGIALVGVGLGLQAQNPRSPALAVMFTALAVAFWFLHAVLFARISMYILGGLCVTLGIGFAGLLILAIGAIRDMRANPPPKDFEVLPADYKVPYSHMHQDPPEVRLAREVEQRRQRLAVQEKELQMLEEKLKRKLQQSDE